MPGVDSGTHQLLARIRETDADQPAPAHWTRDRLQPDPQQVTVPGTRVHYGAGFTGNGVGPSWLVGRVLARLALGEDVCSPLHASRAPSLPPEPLRTVGAAVVRRALLAIDDAETEGRQPPRWAPALRRLPELVGLRVASR